jgi:peptide/nickel transport system ATP-binding protein
VKYVSDRMMVMRSGKVVGIGEADSVYSNPSDEYIKTLIDSVAR